MALIEEQEITHLNLLQIDAEGYDFEVIKMIDFDIIKPSIIKFEHKNLSKRDQEKAHDLLSSNGYAIQCEDCDTFAIL